MTTLQSSDCYVIVLIPSHITENKYFNSFKHCKKFKVLLLSSIIFNLYSNLLWNTFFSIFFVSVTVDGDDGDVGEVGGDGEEWKPDILRSKALACLG